MKTNDVKTNDVKTEVVAMKFFAHRYQIRFSDTMAYGTHHFLTNFQFQCAAREALLFLAEADGSEPWRAQIAPVELLTQQGYSRNLSALGLGDWALVLMAAEELGYASFQLCFRVLSSAGAPVACGYQNIVVLDRETRRVARVPPLIVSRLLPVEETVSGFAEHARRGGAATRQLFPEAVCRLAKELASDLTARTSHGYVALDAPRPSTPPARERPVSTANHTRELPLTLVCGGQGTFDPEWTRQLASAVPEQRALVDAAHELCRAQAGFGFADWLQRPAPGAAGPEQVLREQLTLYLGGLFAGTALLRAGHRPAWVLGHSFGEITAAALGGMLQAESGLRVVWERTRALLTVADEGALLVVHAGGAELAELRRELPELYLAVRNHARQTVLAGPRQSLQQCAKRAARRGVSTSLLPGFAFHSPLLFDAAARFRSAIADVRLGPGELPVFSPFERRVVGAHEDWPSLWASHLIRSLDFEAGLSALLEQGDQRLVVCARRPGLSRILGAIVQGRASSVSLASDTLSDALDETRPRAIAPDHAASDTLVREPLAIVGVGCRLPGAQSFAAFAELLASGACAISDLHALAPELGHDFLAQGFLADGFQAHGAVAPDKTYTLLSGYVNETEVNEAELERAGGEGNGARAPHRSKVLRLAAAALVECRASLVSRCEQGRDVGVVIGSTADGCGEYDEALVLERLAAAEGASSPALAGAIERELAQLGSSAALAHHPALRALASELFGVDVRSRIVDAACASSLYALDVAARWLQGGGSRLVFAGGAFAPGFSNNCLFAQFGGLSRRASLPLDARASGVVFGEGAAFVALRRLSDALADGDRIWGVIRGVGLSSDGQSVAPSTPKAAGQRLAVERGYASSGIDPRTIQYVEAHATGTPVGDATELEALDGFYRAAGVAAGAIRVGSVKSQISHVGWAAGVASLLKVIAALQARELPAQHHFERPTPRIDLGGSPLRIVTTPSPWPDNLGSEPRRAAVNGFGFGGANGHVIVEAFLEPYHRALAARAREARPMAASCVARAEAHPKRGTRPAWPEGARPLLPDVVETLDGSQALAVSLAARCLRSIGETWKQHRQRIGVIVALSGKTDKILNANDRIYRERLRRKLAGGASPTEARATLAALERWLERQPPSNAYTLTGAMPNLAAGRVCQVLDLNGPNLVIDGGAVADGSCPEATEYALALIEDQTCDFVLVIAIGESAVGEQVGAAALLCARELALRHGLPEAPEASAQVAGESRVAAEAPGSAAVAEAPIEVYVPVLQDVRLPEPSSASTGAPTVLLCADAALRERLGALLDRDRYVLAAHDSAVLEERLAASPEPVRALSVTDLGGDVRALLEPGTRRERECLEPLLGLCQKHYEALREGRLALGSLCLNAWAAPDLPRPETGLFGGFIKALGRELARARLAQVHTDADLAAGLDTLLRALEPPIEHRELFVASQRVRVHALSPVLELSHGAPLVSARSVVLVTGGARGINAELAAWLLTQFRCQLVLLGRSDPERTPEAWRSLSPAEVDERADEHYREAVSAGATLRDARRSFLELRAAHEVHVNLRRLAALPGQVSYERCDLTQADAVARSVHALAARYARVDFVVYGAGLQVSSTLPKKSTEVFWSVVDSKLLGLRNLLAALEAQFPGQAPHVHLATSAFSHFGNDGQHDYGAANEALNRLALCSSSATGPSWSSLAWLAWDNLGMTRGSEYRALARTRDMRALRAVEGQALFGRLFTGRPLRAAHVLLTEHERRRYRPLCIAAPPPEPAQESAADPLPSTTWTLSADADPYLMQHRLRGCPVVPACVLLDRMVQHAHEQFPELQLIALERCEFTHALRAPLGRRLALDLHCRRIAEAQGLVTLEAWISADVTTPDGHLLEAGRRHAACRVVLGSHAAHPRLELRPASGGRGTLVLDPYVDPSSPLQLGPGFDCLRALSISSAGNRARHEPPADRRGTPPARALPALLIDALLRVGVIAPLDTQPLDTQSRATGASGAQLGVYVPTFIERVLLAPALGRSAWTEPCSLASGAAQHTDGDIECAWVTAHSDADTPLLALIGYRGRLVARVPARPLSSREALLSAHA